MACRMCHAQYKKLLAQLTQHGLFSWLRGRWHCGQTIPSVVSCAA